MMTSSLQTRIPGSVSGRVQPSSTRPLSSARLTTITSPSGSHWFEKVCSVAMSRLMTINLTGFAIQLFKTTTEVLCIIWVITHWDNFSRYLHVLQLGRTSVTRRASGSLSFSTLNPKWMAKVMVGVSSTSQSMLMTLSLSIIYFTQLSNSRMDMKARILSRIGSLRRWETS